MKKNNVFKLMLLTGTMFSCGGNSTSTSSSKESSSVSESQISEISSSSSSSVDYGTVKFNDIYVYDNDYDHVTIRPIFSNEDLGSKEIFEYEVMNESICYIEDNQVIYLSEGMTKVIAKSEHLNGTFVVHAKKNYDFISKANQHHKRVGNSYNDGDTLFLGDSFFEFWQNGTGISKTFNEVFADYKVFNIGISATTTHDWRAMNYKIVSLTSPKNIVVNIGINNVDDDHEIGVQCANNIKMMLMDYLEEFPQTNIYYLSITKCSGVFANNWSNHEKSNALIKDYCQDNNRLFYLDVMALYGDDVSKYQQDGLHPNQAGYDLFEKIIKDNVPLENK